MAVGTDEVRNIYNVHVQYETFPLDTTCTMYMYNVHVYMYIQAQNKYVHIL